MAELVNIPIAAVRLLYDNEDISEDISRNLISITYTDNVHGKADELEVRLEDSTGLFSGAWYPSKGARLTAYINNLKCGVFSIDEISYTTEPDVITWRGVSAFVTSKLRTKKSKGYENVTLLDIAKEIAKNHDLTVDDGTKTIITEAPDTTQDQKLLGILASQAFSISQIKDYNIFTAAMNPVLIRLAGVAKSLASKGYTKEANNIQASISILAQVFNQFEASRLSTNISKIRQQLYKEPSETKKTYGLGLQKILLERSTQNRESDLAYLSRICETYGIAFNIKPPTMVFYSILNLEATKSSFQIDKTQLSSFSFTDKSEGTFANADVAYSGPDGSQNNKAKRLSSIPEQSLLQILINKSTVAGTVTNNPVREARIQDLNGQATRCLKGLKTKEYLDQYQALLDAYSLIVVDKSVFGCVRFANACKTILSSLKSEQLEAIKANQQSYKGGQSSNTLLVRTRTENSEQVDAVTSAQLHKKNSRTRTGSFSMPGHELALAGSSFDLTGFSTNINAKYFIVTSTHRVDKGGGYTTDIEYRKGAITFVEKNKDAIASQSGTQVF